MGQSSKGVGCEGAEAAEEEEEGGWGNRQKMKGNPDRIKNFVCLWSFCCSRMKEIFICL